MDSDPPPDPKRLEGALRAAEQLARGHVATLAHTLETLSREPALERLAEHVLRSITEQLGAHGPSLSLGEIALAQALAHQAMLALELMRLSSERTAAAVRAEQTRLARDLHDTLAHGLTGVTVHLEAAADARSKGLADEAWAHVTRAGLHARDGLRETRRSLRALRPLGLEGRTLGEALNGLFAKMTTGTTLTAALVVRGTPRQLPEAWEDHLLRIAQEVLTNSIRHGRARRFDARLTFADDGPSLDLTDDGIGFALETNHDGLGLLGIRERVELMGGRLSIQSRAGAGVAISISLPRTGRS